jgi:DNA modification methylase
MQSPSISATMPYEEFLRAKLQAPPSYGFEIADAEIHPILKPHQRDIVRWAVHRGRAAIFAAFGLGKTIMQLEASRILAAKTGGRFLIVAPLGVRAEFMHDAAMLGITLTFVRSIEECGSSGLYITNYETVREGKLDPRLFAGVSLDEAGCLRGFGGTKTFRQMMAYFEGSGKFRIVATATPSPNDYIELLAYAAFLDIMDVSQGKTRFFKRNPKKADELTLFPHREREFWLWCSTWGVFLQKPSDLGHSDEGYVLPSLDVHWHEIPSNHENAGQDPSGQGRLLRNSTVGIGAAAREKRDSISARVAGLEEIVSAHDRTLYGFQQFIVWCELNDEQAAVDKALELLGCPMSSLYGRDGIDEREKLMLQWRAGETAAFVSKPSMYGAGANLQQCHHEIFLGIGFKFFDFIQAIHRTYRFLQKQDVRIDLLYTEAERGIKADLEEKWEKHKELVAQMSAIIRQYGLGHNALGDQMNRNMGVVRQEDSGAGWRAIYNDCIPETKAMEENSVDLILTSIPFSTQYEYSPNYSDFGHTDSNEHFWEQMDYLIPELLRVLSPGRVAAIHVKDRITPSGLTGMGFQTVYPFSDDCIHAFTKHGFGFLARKTIVTDVVRENNQTYRLGWSEQCKDGSRMGCGMPEYLLLFRKPPTDTSNGYADNEVVKSKRDYTRSRWQIDAHGFARSSGNRLLAPLDLEGVPHERIFKLFRADSLQNVYDFKRHVELSESLERCQECGHVHTGDRRCELCACKIAGSRLPATFMLLQPQSWHDDVWTDVARMRTMNMLQAAAGKEMHLCPIQFDIADRVIEQFSNRGELVFDPFMGIGTVPLRALIAGRRGIGIELAWNYYADSVAYLRGAETDAEIPTLFDLFAVVPEEANDAVPAS